MRGGQVRALRLDDIAWRWLIGPSQNFGQRALPRSVGPNDRMNLTAMYVKISIVKRNDAGESLTESQGLQMVHRLVYFVRKVLSRLLSHLLWKSPKREDRTFLAIYTRW